MISWSQYREGREKIRRPDTRFFICNNPAKTLAPGRAGGSGADGRAAGAAVGHSEDSSGPDAMKLSIPCPGEGVSLTVPAFQGHLIMDLECFLDFFPLKRTRVPIPTVTFTHMRAEALFCALPSSRRWTKAQYVLQCCWGEWTVNTVNSSPNTRRVFSRS